MSGFEVLGVVANIIQVVDFSFAVLNRLKEYQSTIGELPKSLKHTKIQLPALLDALNLMKASIENDSMKESSRAALLPIIDGCRSQIEALDGVMKLILPVASDSRIQRNTKALKSLRYQGKIDKIMSVIKIYIQTLSYYVSTLSALRDQIPLRAIATSTVPFRRDADFVDRKVLAIVDQKLQDPASRMALVGLGGIGKSQIAIEYSYRLRDKSPETWVFWVHAGTAPRFENDYRRIAETVKVPGYKDPKADILRLVHAWLNDESNGRWVMVIDNADDVNVFFPEANTSLDRTHSLLDYIPQSWNGSVLLTSRNQDLAQILTGTKANVVEVAPMDTADGLLLLHNRLGGDFDEQSAAELLRLLDNMPLAITQAAAYIQRHAPRMTIQRYIDELRKGDQSRASLLRKDIKDIRRDGKASNSIMETWNITFELLRQDRPSAARLLSLMSHFDRQSIPEFLLHGRFWGAQHLATDQNDLDEKVGFGLEESFVYKGKSIEQTTNITAELDDNQEDSFEEDIHTLISYSLVKVSDTGDTFEMHRLVQFSTKQWLELHRELEEWKVIYANLLHNVFPLHPEPKDWPTCHILFPHLQASIASRPEAHHALENWASVLYKGGWYANEMENSEIAKEMLGHALKAAKDTVGADDTTTLNIISELGTAVVRLNNLEEAESMHRQVLETRMRILGPEHRDTVLSMKNIALVLRRQKRLQEAEELQVKGMNILKRVLGHEAPETIDLMASLAITYGTQGRFRDEEVLERQVLELSRKTMGNLHRDTLTSMHNLANTLKNQGRVGEAISMMSTCLELREKVIGVQHPFTISSRKIVQELEQVVSQSKEEGG